jgi:microcystin-dependent protein
VANDPNPNNNVLGESSAVSLYNSGNATAAMAPQSISPTGGGQPHTNFQPYLCIDFIISLFGIFPSPT